MILTRTFLNTRQPNARKLLASPQVMHAAVMAAFGPDMSERTLWRVDHDSPLRPTLFIVSPQPPDLAHLDQQAGWPEGRARSAAYGPFLEGLEEGQVWAFRLVANPTHRAQIDGRKLTVAHVTVRQQLRWLQERCEAWGFSIGPEEEPTALVTGRQVKRFRRQGSQVTLGTARFEGVLTVTDATALARALSTGMGRAKAYGCGLMTLAAP